MVYKKKFILVYPRCKNCLRTRFQNFRWYTLKYNFHLFTINTIELLDFSGVILS